MLWSESKRKDAQELISWLLQSKPAANSWTIDHAAMIAVSELAYSSSDTALSNEVAMAVLDRMYVEGLSLVADFELLYSQIKQERVRAERAGRADWSFYIPVDLTMHGSMRSRRMPFFGQIVELLSVNRVLSILPPDPGIIRVGREFIIAPRGLSSIVSAEVDFHPGAFLKISGKGLDLHDAWEDAEPVFGAFRGLFEFSFGYGGGRFTIAGPEEPRSQLPHPEWVFAVRSGGVLEGLAFDIDYKRKPSAFEMTSERWGLLRRNARMLSADPPKGSTESVIADSLRLYAEAMDARFPHDTLLGFWQVGEAITLSEMVGGQTEKVAERLSWHFTKLKLPGSGFGATLRRLGQMRNNIVHRGIHNVSDADANIMKLACDIALLWLIRARASLPTTHHLAEFYRLREANKSTLEALNSTLSKSKQRVAGKLRA